MISRRGVSNTYIATNCNQLIVGSKSLAVIWDSSFVNNGQQKGKFFYKVDVQLRLPFFNYRKVCARI